MTDFRQLLRYMATSYSIGHHVGQHLGQRLAPSGVVPAYAQQAFTAYTPRYWTPAGLLSARLDKTEMFNGRPTAYYSMVYFNAQIGRYERRAWRYVLRNGVPTEHKAFPATVR